MNKTLLHGILGVVLALFSTSALAQDTEDVTEVLSATSDVSLRSDNADKANATANALEMYTVRTDGVITKDFVGLMSFTVPAKTGYVVKSATLRLTTERAKGTLVIYALGADVSDADTYNSQKDNIAAARQTTALALQKLNGTNNKATFDAGASSNIEDWQNYIDLTDYVKSIGSGNVNLLLANNAESTSTSIQVYTSDAQDVTNTTVAPNFTFAAADLYPQLTVVYQFDAYLKTDTSTSTADTWIRSGNTTKHGSETTMELCVYTNESDATKNKTFLGLMSFQMPTEVSYSNYTVKSAQLRLVTERVKGARGIKLYNYGTFDESTIYANEESAVTEAINDNNLVASFNAKGSNKAMSYDQLPTEYQTADAWTNNINITNYVNSLSDNSFSLLFVKDNSSESTKFYTRELKDSVINEKDSLVRFAAADLIPQLTVEYTLANYTLNVTDAGAATLVLPYEAQIPADVKAYTLTYTSGNKATATPVTGVIPANTPVLVNAAEGKYDFKATTTLTRKADSPASGCLYGAWAETEAPVGSYVLQNQSGTVAFYRVATEGIKISANQAYLLASGAQGAGVMNVSYGDTTGITDVDAAANSQTKTGNIYTIDGKKVDNARLSKGQVYVTNGKAFIVK